MIIKEALDAFVLANKRQWKHPRHLTVGSSEIGMCARRVWYTKNKQKPDDDYVEEWGASARGNLIENHLWEPALKKKYGAQLKFSGKQQKTFIDGPVSATPDGVLTGLKRDFLSHLGVTDIGTDCIVLECKTADPRTNLDKAKAHNIYQTQVQMGLVRKLTPYQPNFALLSYADASFPDRIKEFAIPFDPNVFAEAQKRAKKILEAKSDNDVAPEDFIAGGANCIHCPFLRTCGIERRNLPFQDNEKPVDPQVRAEIVDMVRELVTLDGMIEGNKAQYRLKEVNLKNRLRDFKLRKIKGVLNWTTVRGRTSYNNEAIRVEAQRAGVDIEKHMRTGDETDRLTLSLTGQDS